MDLLAPVSRFAARERSETRGRDELLQVARPSIPHARAAGPPTGRSFFLAKTFSVESEKLTVAELEKAVCERFGRQVREGGLRYGRERARL